MKPADFFETSCFLENGETIDNKPSAIFFNGGVKMRKTAKITAILTILVLMFADGANWRHIAGESIPRLKAQEKAEGSIPRLRASSTLKRTMGLAGFSLPALSASALIPRR